MKKNISLCHKIPWVASGVLSNIKVVEHLSQGNLRRTSVVVILVHWHREFRPVNVDMLPLVGVLLEVTHEVDQVIVCALSLHVREALHVLQVPLSPPVPQGLVPEHLLHQHHVRVVYIAIPQIQTKDCVSNGENSAQESPAVGSIVIVESQLRALDHPTVCQHVTVGQLALAGKSL